jgi:hypothetical protein
VLFIGRLRGVFRVPKICKAQSPDPPGAGAVAQNRRKGEP